jgi:hypothetical protein
VRDTATKRGADRISRGPHAARRVFRLVG